MRIDFRKNWHRFAGSAFVGLFLLLLFFRLGYFEEKAAEIPLENAPPVHAGAESWLVISQEGRKIGYAHRRFLPTATGYHLTEDVLMHINTMGVVQALSFKTEGELDARMNLRSFNFYLDSSLFRFIAHGFVRDRLLTLHLGQPGEEKKLEIPIKGALHLAAGILETSRFKGLLPGESRTYYVFDPATLSERPVRIALAGREVRIVLKGKIRHARKLSLDFMGATQFAWIGEDGTVLREKGILGITLEQSTREEALSGRRDMGSADLTELASLPANKTITSPGTLQELKVRLGNLGEGKFTMDGGRQTWQRGILTIRKEGVPISGRGKALPLKDRDALKPGPLIQSDDPQIVAKTIEIVAAGDSDIIKARKLVNWAYNNIKKRPVLSVPNALETLQNMVGDCNEHAVLLAALARAAGIPAEMEAGLVYLRGRFYYHAWNALYLKNGWVTADAVLGQFPADVTHIRLVRGAAEKQMDLLGLIGRLKLEIIDFSPSAPAEPVAKGQIR